MNPKEGQFDNTVDLGIARMTKKATGTPRKVPADKPDMLSHENFAMELGNSAKKPKKNLFDKTMEYLGL